MVLGLVQSKQWVIVMLEFVLFTKKMKTTFIRSQSDVEFQLDDSFIQLQQVTNVKHVLNNSLSNTEELFYVLRCPPVPRLVDDLDTQRPPYPCFLPQT